MNADIMKGKWHELKGSLKTQWARLTDDDVTAIDGQVERLVGIVQQRYGYAKDRAQAEVEQYLRDSDRAASQGLR